MYTFFRSSILNFYGCQNIMVIKLVTRLRLGLINLRENKSKHSFEDTFNPLYNCGMDIESFAHFLLQCPSYINERCTLMSSLNRLRWIDYVQILFYSTLIEIAKYLCPIYLSSPSVLSYLLDNNPWISKKETIIPWYL